MGANQFGNFIAGYAGYHSIWSLGIVFVTSGGWWFDWVDDTIGKRPFNHDMDSQPDIEAGFEHAAYEEALKRSGYAK